MIASQRILLDMITSVFSPDDNGGAASSLSKAAAAAAATGDGSKGKKRELVKKLEVECSAAIDIGNDGFKWRKYGQKVYKGGTEPRAYYKCCVTNCPARKTVEVAREGVKLCVYQANHSHMSGAAASSPKNDGEEDL